MKIRETRQTGQLLEMNGVHGFHRIEEMLRMRGDVRAGAVHGRSDRNGELLRIAGQMADAR